VKESKKNSSKPVNEKLEENPLKIMKMKNDPYNKETRFTHQDPPTLWRIGGISHFLFSPLLHHEAHPHLSKRNYG
jgi:hypothetical protein